MYSRTSEPVQFQRNCQVVMIPSGDPVEIPEGTMGYITQALGGSFTVFIEGNLFRVAGIDADALDKEIVPPPKLPDNATDDDVNELITRQLKTCYDPEIPVDLLELGLIYEKSIHHLDNGNRKIVVRMTLTAPGCGMGDILVDDVRSKLLLIPTIEEIDVQLVFDPPWNQEMMSDIAKLETGML